MKTLLISMKKDPAIIIGNIATKPSLIAAKYLFVDNLLAKGKNIFSILSIIIITPDF
jgi:hypothetical protein